MTEEEQQQTKLLSIVREAIKRDEAMRQKFEIGDKFRFVRERLKEILAYLETEKSAQPVVQVEAERTLAQDELAVYVYLYNTKGTMLRNWLNMLTQKVFYEYSVNRPIYSDKEGIEALLKTKPDKQLHAYLVVAVKSSDILSTSEDAQGNKLIRVKEGSLKIEKLLSFYHNGYHYRMSAEGELVKK